MPSNALRGLKMGNRRPGVRVAIIVGKPGGPPGPPMMPIGGANAKPPEESPPEEATETPTQETAEQPDKPEDMVRSGLQQLADNGLDWAKTLLTRFNGLMKIDGPQDTDTGATDGTTQATGTEPAAS